MPELPEVENVGRALREALVGRRLTGLAVAFAGVLGQPPATTREALLGKRLRQVHRHGKYLVLTFTKDEGAAPAHLMLHLRMTGQVFVLEGYEPDAHVHLTFDFEGLAVHYRDVRKFGRWTLVDDPVRPSCLAHVGPDMLALGFTEWERRLAKRGAPLKALLLDQGLAAGIGNIYADESLFRAGVHPLDRPGDLTKARRRRLFREAQAVLRLAIDEGGTTFLNFTNFHGRPGNFRQALQVYGRGGEPCDRCGTTIFSLRVAGRSTCFCPRCQPASAAGGWPASR